ncbi:MAG: amidase [Myxococcales bacterium]|nr:MAG: amidase [Myxococcales bacterium]
MAEEITDATASLEAMASGSLRAVELVASYLDRLEAQQETLNGAVQIFRSEALERAKSPKSGPLSGLPFSVKETFGMKGEQITAGSLRMPPIVCDEDSEIVKRVKNAGAIIIARSNIPEFAMAGETDNPRFGRSNNPLNTSRTCGGSSGGEGVLVASGSSAVGLGSDVLGSLRIPGCFCGVVAFKPASNAVDKWGTWPVIDGYMDSWLSLGPITRSVRDARLLYNVIADKPTAPLQSVKALRLILPTHFPINTKVSCIAAALSESIAALLDSGMQGEDYHFDDVERFFTNLQPLLAHDFESDIRKQLKTEKGKDFSIVKEAVLQILGKPTIYSGLFQLLLACPIVRTKRPEKIERIVADFENGRRRYAQLLKDDAILVFPTLGLLAPEHGKMNRASLKPGVNKDMTSVAFCNAMNLPAITVPAPKFRDEATGLVPGIMLATAPGNESILFDAASVVESALGESEK